MPYSDSPGHQHAAQGFVAGARDHAEQKELDLNNPNQRSLLELICSQPEPVTEFHLVDASHPS